MLVDDLMDGKNNLVKEDIFKMDTFLENVKMLKGIEKLQKINEYHNLDNMIESYKIKLDETFMHHDGNLGNIILKRVGKNPYQRTIDLPFEGEYYNLIWNVEKLVEVINENKIKPRWFSVTKLMKVVDKEGINEFALDNAKGNKMPIIVGYFSQLNPSYIVLDGNHRVMSRYQRHKCFIKGYELLPQYLAKGLAGDIFKDLFFMHLNIYTVLTYIVGKISEKQLREQIIPVINNLY